MYSNVDIIVDTIVMLDIITASRPVQFKKNKSSSGRLAQNKDWQIEVDRKWPNFQTGLIGSKKYHRCAQKEININTQDKPILTWLNY